MLYVSSQTRPDHIFVTFMSNIGKHPTVVMLFKANEDTSKLKDTFKGTVCGKNGYPFYF